MTHQKRVTNRVTAALEIWDNEGGAAERTGRGYRFGRRFEADRSWTIYHVYTGVPAQLGNLRMIGLDKPTAAHALHVLNAG